MSRAILDESQSLEVNPDFLFCAEGDPATRLFMVKHGQARYSRLSREGRETILYWLGPGDAFGLGTLAPEFPPYLGTATSVSRCEVLWWDHATVRRLALTYPQLASNAIAVVWLYLSYLTQRHGDVFSRSAKSRIAKVVVELGERVGRLTPHGVDLQITNEQLASLADVSPFTVSRTLSTWANKGALKKNRKALRIRSPEKVIQLVE